MKLQNIIALLSIGLISTTSICMYSDEILKRQQETWDNLDRIMEQQRKNGNEGLAVEGYIKSNQPVPSTMIFSSSQAAHMAQAHNRRLAEQKNQLANQKK